MIRATLRYILSLVPSFPNAVIGNLLKVGQRTKSRIPAYAGMTGRLLLVLILLTQTLSIKTTQAAFEDLGVGARAPGMGEAHIAVADDANAIYYNPAGLIQMVQGQIATEYSQFVKGLDDGSSLGQTYLGYGAPYRKGYQAFGIAYKNFKADNLFNERTIILGYGHRMKSAPLGWKGIFSTGVNLKQLHREFEPDRFTENALNDAGVSSNTSDPLFGSGSAKDAFAFDVGTLYQFGPNYNYSSAVTIMNVNKPDVSLAGDGDKAPMSTKIGFAYRPVWGLMSGEVRRVQRLQGQMDTDLGLGIERNFRLTGLGAMTLRGGYQTGSRNFKAINAGMSYYFARMALDYAFGFPVGALSDAGGTHRLSLTFKLGTVRDEEMVKDYRDANLLTTFAYDGLATHVLIARAAKNYNFTPQQRQLMIRLLMRRYPLEDNGLAEARPELAATLKNQAVMMDWPELKYALTNNVMPEDRMRATESLELYARGDSKAAKARLSMLSPSSRRDAYSTTVLLMALADQAAAAYRVKDLDVAIDNVRMMVELMPNDEIIMKGYRDLLAERSAISERFANEAEQMIAVPPTLPEAPQTLVAPKLVGSSPISTATEFEAMVKSFGVSLGYYLSRKAAGRPASELEILLNQMKAVYSEFGIDMSIVDRELQALGKPVTAPAPVVTPAPVPTPEPVVTPEPAVAPVAKPVVEQPKPVVKPTPVVTPEPVVEEPKEEEPTVPGKTDTELDRAWNYYREMNNRDISDHERIEILQSMLRRFGEKSAPRILKELERIRKRVGQ